MNKVAIDENNNSHILNVCNTNCINAGEIDKMSMKELFCVIIFLSN